jgi:hypothetical protein
LLGEVNGRDLREDLHPRATEILHDSPRQRRPSRQRLSMSLVLRSHPIRIQRSWTLLEVEAHTRTRDSTSGLPRHHLWNGAIARTTLFQGRRDAVGTTWNRRKTRFRNAVLL